MTEPQIRFDDGAAYERMMGVWSQLAGKDFLAWLAPAPALRWVDVGCGNGAFTELFVDNCAPTEVQGVDPSDGQIAYARTRIPSVRFQTGDAMALPFPDRSFDVAVMALVIFFIPDPPKGVSEMVRVIAPGGLVAAYAWDMMGGGFPLQIIGSELRDLGFSPPRPPSFEVSKVETLDALWKDVGLEDVSTCRIDVERSFVNFDDFWGSVSIAPTLGAILESLKPDVLASLKARVRARLSEDAQGRVSYRAWANAVKGRVPA